jgi:hypothetical protein
VRLQLRFGGVSLDFSVYERLNDYAAHHDRFEDFLRFFSVDGQVVFIALLAVLFFARGKYPAGTAATAWRRQGSARSSRSRWPR